MTRRYKVEYFKQCESLSRHNPNLNVCTGRGSFWLCPLICRTSLEAFLSLLSAASS